MKTKLISQGNSWGFYINKTWSLLMGLSRDNYEVVLYIEKQKLFIKHNQNGINTHTNTITKKLIKRGSGYAITLTQPILNLLDIVPESDTIEVNLENGVLTIEKM